MHLWIEWKIKFVAIKNFIYLHISMMIISCLHHSFARWFRERRECGFVWCGKIKKIITTEQTKYLSNWIHCWAQMIHLNLFIAHIMIILYTSICIMMFELIIVIIMPHTQRVLCLFISKNWPVFLFHHNNHPFLREI